MRFLTTLVLFFLTPVAIAPAQDAPANRIYYGSTAIAEAGASVGGLVGMRWTDRIGFTALEAEHLPGVPAAYHPIAETRTTTRISLLAGISSDDNWSVYGRLGLHHNSAPAPSGATSSASTVRLGLGAQYLLGSGLTARAEYDRQIKDGDTGLNLSRSAIRLGLIQNF